ncbi:ribosome biogenesis GTP-binding protein YihA/YsxC [Rappaport israeli]|uniref:ribosome biogenesis GTP-binding protein YihA/YsxC n=1 Tax=Rappaport israeli TaxID=1839807 RepID=UPI00093061FC|nr:ribosome biogenesis GTP-binding protein YihA/YsxC [Rappaport israeli]
MISPYQQATFAFSVNTSTQLPNEAEIEVAFVGRSNAGKSSALNALTNQKALARVSKTPGRTQLINYFNLPKPNHYLVDLPGYGYASVPTRIRAHWQDLLGNYLLTRQPLQGVVLIMDIRHPLKTLDMQMLDCCHARVLPVHILLTKADKFKRGAQAKQLLSVEKALTDFPAPVSVQTFSSLKKQGLDLLTARLNQWFDVNNNTKTPD